MLGEVEHDHPYSTLQMLDKQELKIPPCRATCPALNSYPDAALYVFIAALAAAYSISVSPGTR